MTQIKKIIILKYHLLLLYATTNHLSVFYITISNQFHGWIEKKLQSISQSRTCIQNMWWSLFGGPLWIRAKPLYLRSMLSKSMRCTENRNTCRQPWSTEWAQFFSVTMPNLTACPTTSTSEVKWIGLWSSALSAIFTSPLTNWLPLLQAPRRLFAGKTPPTSRMQKMLSKSSLNAEAWISILRE